MRKNELAVLALSFFLVICLAFHVPPSNGLEKSDSAVLTKSDPRINNFIQTVRQAGSLHDISRAAKAANFSQTDMPPIMEAFKDPAIKNKIQTLARNSRTIQSDTAPNITLLKQEKTSSQMQQISKMNQSVETRFSSIAAPKISLSDRAISVSPATTTPKTLMSGTSGLPGIDALITGHTIPARIGQRINVSGAHFGAATGRVVVLVNRMMVECPVHSWRDSQISITLPYELGVAMGPRDIEGTVWVKLPGGEIGPTAPIRLQQLVPVITSLSSSKIMPGQQLLIEGENFYPEAVIGPEKGSVRLELSGRTFSGSDISILNWQDNAVRIRLSESLSRVSEMLGNVVITSPSGAKAIHRITFEPLLDVETIISERFSIQNDEFECNYCDRIYEIIMVNMALFFRNMVGFREEKTVFSDVVLQNQWKVVSSHLNTSGGGAGHGANILTAPTPGSNIPRLRLEYWADGFAWVRTSAHVVIEGPRGLDH